MGKSWGQTNRERERRSSLEGTRQEEEVSRDIRDSQWMLIWEMLLRSASFLLVDYPNTPSVLLSALLGMRTSTSLLYKRHQTNARVVKKKEIPSGQRECIPAELPLTYENNQCLFLLRYKTSNFLTGHSANHRLRPPLSLHSKQSGFHQLPQPPPLLSSP